jgi:hypothetical protein
VEFNSSVLILYLVQQGDQFSDGHSVLHGSYLLCSVRLCPSLFVSLL